MVDPRVLLIVVLIGAGIFIGQKTVEGVKKVGHKIGCVFHHCDEQEKQL